MQLIEQELRVSKEVRNPWCIQHHRKQDEFQSADADNCEIRPNFKRAKLSEVCTEPSLPWPLPSSTLCHPLEEPSPLGLTLRKTPSFLELASQSLNKTLVQSNLVPSSSDLGTQGNENCIAGGFSVSSFSTKLKAANFPATVLRIGAWERSSRYEGDVVGKCYYAKQKLVWEVLENGLKNKIEVQWSAISALKAKFSEHEPGLLEVEVSRPPLFFRETNPQPRKHTLWQATSDFTGGEATVCKRHLLWFAEGVLNKHYEKLLQCDSRLKALATVEKGSTVLLANTHNVVATEEPQTPIFEPDCQMKVSNHLSPCDLVFEDAERSSSFISISQFKLDQDEKVSQISSLVVSSPSSVNDTWTTEENYTSKKDDFLSKDDVMAFSDMQSEDGTSVLSGDSFDTMTDCGMLFVSGGVASSENFMMNETTHSLLGEQSTLFSEEKILFSSYGCATSAMLDETENKLTCALLEGLPVAEINNNSFEAYEGHVYNSPNSNNAADVKGGLSDTGSLNNLLSDALDSVKQCFRNDSSEDVLVNLPRIASLPQLFQISKDVCHSRHENICKQCNGPDI